MTARSAKSLIASRRNLALNEASYCNHCNTLVPDDFQKVHLREKHGIKEGNNYDSV